MRKRKHIVRQDLRRIFNEMERKFEASIIWIGQEARRYRGMFCSSVEKATQMQQVNQDYGQQNLFYRRF